MQSAIFKTVLLAATTGFLALAPAAPSQARDGRFLYATHAYRYPTQAYSIYQAPDGSYDSLADLTRDVWGIPCGVVCTQKAQARWAGYPYRHPYGP